ncbi:hypothetical protein Nepgr_017919 [Nepenthes gracilis]|uniref:Uncharacterized protein n=1 Tax=Nepenthes gracilis TaxID=150966 RepID=A0AAD3XSY7_NEPGR|nr:hypothetical protein Nepgr_017919 [Nepenthes gracilis]
MNVQAHISGQIPSQVPSQAGSQFHGLPQQNGNPLQMQMQNQGGQRATLVMESDVVKVRRFIQEKIYEFLLQRQAQPHEIPRERILDIVKRLEGGLFKAAASKEEYMNLDTLESRLQGLIKRVPLSSQHSQFVNSSTPINTMIPTPGMQHNRNSDMMVSSSVDTPVISSSGCSNMSSSTTSSGTLFPSATGPFASMHSGSLSNGYQQASPNFSISSSGNASVSMGGQKVTSQMIPTPGFSGISNPAFMNVETASNCGGFSSADSSVAPQPVPQKQHAVGQNIRILQNLGSQIGCGIRSTMQQRSIAFHTGSVNGGFGNSLQMMNGSGSPESYVTTTLGGSPKPLQQQFDHHQRPLIQGDGYGISATESTRSGRFHGPGTPIGSMMNNTQNFTQVRLQTAPRSNLIACSQSNVQTTQPASHLRPQSSEQLEKLKFQSSVSWQENLSHYHQQQYQHQPHRQQMPATQRPHALLKNDVFGPLQLSADVGSHVKPEHQLECPNEVPNSQVSAQFQLSEFQTQLQQNTSENHPTSSQFSSLPSGPQDTRPTLSPNLNNCCKHIS